MKKREINIFSVSFLDLLSGALAAVIILFIVVPKMDAESKEASETLKELKLEASQLAEMVARLDNSVDSSLYKMIAAQMQELQASLQQAGAEVQELRRQNERLQAELDQQQLRLEREQQQAEAARREAEQARQDAKLFGVNAELAIVFQWQEEADIDLYLYSVEQDAMCYFNKKETSFATLLRDITQSTGDSYEMIYQEELVPGTYRLYINLYSPQQAGFTAHTSGYIKAFPFSGQEQSIHIPSMQLSYRPNGESNPLLVKEFRVTKNGISE